MNYKIVRFDEITGQLIVEYAVGMAPLSIDVPIENGLYITGEKLESYIAGFIPTWHIERMAQINAGIPNKDELKALAQEAPTEVELPSVLTPEQTANAQMWADVDFEQRLAAALVKFGILDTNPTELPVSAQ